MTNAALNYDDRHIALLEALWGDGYLSPGGAEEVARGDRRTARHGRAGAGYR